MKIQPDLNYLKYFYYVAKLDGFTKAANHLKVQQPVVSRAVKLLEKELGCFLIERQKKKIILTSEGKKIFTQCELIFSTVNNISEMVSNKNPKEEYVFSFASSDSLSYGLLEKMILLLRKDYPNVIFHHQAGSIKNFLEEILSGNIELGFFFNIPKLPAGLVKSKILDMDFHYVVRKDLKANKNIINSFIATISTSHESPNALPLFKKYKSLFHEAHVCLISNSSITRKSMVINGLGASILPDFMITEELKNNTLVKVAKSEQLALYVVERQGAYRNKLKSSLISLVKETAES